MRRVENVSKRPTKVLGAPKPYRCLWKPILQDASSGETISVTHCDCRNSFGTRGKIATVIIA